MTTSPGRNCAACFCAVRVLLEGLSAAISAGTLSISTGAASADSAPSANTEDASLSPAAVSVEMTRGSGSPSTRRAASANSLSTKVNVTSANPMGGRLAVPLKMQSDIRSARSVLWLCSPSTHEIASTMLDLPHPFGPMMQLSPAPLKVRCVFSQNDLNPTNSTLRSLSKRPLMFRHASPKQKHFGRYGFGFLEKRGYATTTLA